MDRVRTDNSRECGWSGRRLLVGGLDLLLELLEVDVHLTLDLLDRAKLRLLERLADGDVADDEQRGLALVDDLAELLDVLARQALPEVTADTADDARDDGRAEDRRREQDADDRADGHAAERT